jgi:hypothetical protein
VTGSQSNLSNLSFHLNNLGILGRQPGIAYTVIAGARPDLITSANILNRDNAPAREDQFPLGDTYLIQHGTCGVVATAHVGTVRTLEEDHRLGFADQDLRLRVLDVAVGDLAPVEYAQDTRGAFDGNGPGVRQGLGDKEPFGAEAVPVCGMVEYALNKPF